MKTAVIACKTVEEELRAAMGRTGTDYPITFLEQGLHNTPKKLTARLNETLAGIEADRVLLAMGFCGNAMAGVCAERSELVLPRADDCITLLLGSAARRTEVSSALAAYFLTEGWMRGERNLWAEYLHTVERYGEETARQIARMLYGHYRTLALLDCGTGSVEALTAQTKEAAETLHLRQQILPGTLRYLEALLTGPWDKARFLVKPAGSAIRPEELSTPRDPTGFEPDSASQSAKGSAFCLSGPSLQP